MATNRLFRATEEACHCCNDPRYDNASLPERRFFIRHASLEVLRKATCSMATPLLTKVSSVPQVGLCVLILGREIERQVVCASIFFVGVLMGPYRSLAFSSE